VRLRTAYIVINALPDFQRIQRAVAQGNRNSHGLLPTRGEPALNLLSFLIKARINLVLHYLKVFFVQME